MLFTLLNILGLLISVVIAAVIVQFVLSLLLVFNVVNRHNPAVDAVWTAVNAILDPILRPIRRIMPDTGQIDFSPMVLIIILQILTMILNDVPKWVA